MESRQINSEELHKARYVSYALGALAILVGLALSGAAASAATVVVGDCTSATGLPTIVAGVAAANPGDTVEVCPGTYPEQVPIIENITLTGVPGKANPVITYTATPECFSVPGFSGAPGFCPEIYVYSTTSATIQRVTLDGSNFPNSFCSNNDTQPAGVLFQDSSGTLRNSNVINQSCRNGLGQGIVAYPTVQGGNSVTITDNTISGFGLAINISGIIYPSFTMVDETGTISNNTISNTASNPGDWAVLTGYTTDFKISSNTISVQPGMTGVYDLSDKNITVSLNNITAGGPGIELADLDLATVNFNTLNVPQGAGVAAYCIHQSSIGFNTITGQPGTPPPDVAGIELLACEEETPQMVSTDNNIVLNAIKNFCAGILTGPPTDTDNNIRFNVFANITPGLDIMPGDTCPVRRTE